MWSMHRIEGVNWAANLIRHTSGNPRWMIMQWLIWGWSEALLTIYSSRRSKLWREIRVSTWVRMLDLARWEQDLIQGIDLRRIHWSHEWCQLIKDLRRREVSITCPNASQSKGRLTKFKEFYKRNRPVQLKSLKVAQSSMSLNWRRIRIRAQRKQHH